MACLWHYHSCASRPSAMPSTQTLWTTLLLGFPHSLHYGLPQLLTVRLHQVDPVVGLTRSGDWE